MNTERFPRHCHERTDAIIPGLVHANGYSLGQISLGGKQVGIARFVPQHQPSHVRLRDPHCTFQDFFKKICLVCHRSNSLANRKNGS